MGITLDGTTYADVTMDDTITEEKVGHTYRSATGKLRRQDANVMDLVYTLSILCTYTQKEQLRTSFKKMTPGSALLDFTDQQGIRWATTAGTDTPTIKYGTGVYFESLQITPLGSAGFAGTSGTFIATLTLRVNALATF